MEEKEKSNMDENHILRDCIISASLLLGAVYLNWLGMAPPTRTVGRLLGISGYLLLSAILIFWVISRPLERSNSAGRWLVLLDRKLLKTKTNRGNIYRFRGSIQCPADRYFYC